MAEKKTWEQMSKGERTASIVGLCIAVMVGIALIGGFVSAITSPSPQREEEQVVETIEPVTTYDNVEETEVMPFEKTIETTSSLDSGEEAITTEGKNGVRTKTYYVTYVDGKETGRELFKEEVTKEPVAEVTSIGTREPYVPPASSPAPQAQQSSCDPNYSGCVPIASDVDCAGGSGNGPAYAGMVQVIGSDIYGLDRDGDGWACE